jgi:hypothetical protein
VFSERGLTAVPGEVDGRKRNDVNGPGHPIYGSIDLVALFVNTVAFNGRCIPPRRVARRSHTLGMLASRALRCGRLGHLGASPYLRTGPLRMPRRVCGESFLRMPEDRKVFG